MKRKGICCGDVANATESLTIQVKSNSSISFSKYETTHMLRLFLIDRKKDPIFVLYILRRPQKHDDISKLMSVLELRPNQFDVCVTGVVCCFLFSILTIKMQFFSERCTRGP